MTFAEPFSDMVRCDAGEESATQGNRLSIISTMEENAWYVPALPRGDWDKVIDGRAVPPVRAPRVPIRGGYFPDGPRTVGCHYTTSQ